MKNTHNLDHEISETFTDIFNVEINVYMLIIRGLEL